MTRSKLLWASIVSVLAVLMVSIPSHASPKSDGETLQQHSSSVTQLQLTEARQTSRVNTTFNAGFCRGTFTNPIANATPGSNRGSAQYGAYLQCTSPVSKSIQVFIQPCFFPNGERPAVCVREAEVAGNFAFGTGYFTRSDAYFGCQIGEVLVLRPVARNITVKGKKVRNKYGRVNLVICGFDTTP